MPRVETNRIKASILLIGYQKEDGKMFPHLYDFLQNLRSAYDDVIYIDGEDRGSSLYTIDLFMRNIRDIFDFKKWLRKRRGREESVDSVFDANVAEITDLKSLLRALIYLPRRSIGLLITLILYVRQQRRLVRNLKNAKLKYDKGFVLAVDHTACVVAEKCFPGKVVFWSYDILAKDSLNRIRNGFLERRILSRDALKAKALIIQDEERRKLLEESLGTSFPKTIYLPVSLNDSEFCRKASENRQKKTSFSTVKIVQSGAIRESRWSLQLIEAYQNWPAWFELTLRGFIEVPVKKKLSAVKRKPNVPESMYDNDNLPQVLNDYDIGFVGYARRDNNHKYIENASSQMVELLRLGIPVIGCGSSLFNDFVTRQNIGVGISSIEEMEGAVKKIVANYPSYSHNARRLYELRYNLNSHFDNYLIKSFESLM